MLLRAKPKDAKRIGGALTGVMAAALTKLMDVHELIYAAKKLKRSGKARTLVGAAGTLSSRLQPNHPTDDLDAMTALDLHRPFDGLGRCADRAQSGDRHGREHHDGAQSPRQASPRNRRADADLRARRTSRRSSSVSRAGAPVEIMFQSLAGTDRTLIEEFDVTVDLLDQAYLTMAKHGPLGERSRAVHVFRDGPGQRAHLRQAQRHRHDDDGSALLRPRAPLRSVHGQQRHGLHRA